MPLDSFQEEILKLIAANRTADAHIAGCSARKPQGPSRECQVDPMAEVASHGTLGAWLNHVNVSVPRDALTTPDQLVAALKNPEETLRKDDHVAHALRAFMLETEEIALLRIAREGQVSWSDLDRAATLTLGDGNKKKDWIHESAVARGAVPARRPV